MRFALCLALVLPHVLIGLKVSRDAPPQGPDLARHDEDWDHLDNSTIVYDDSDENLRIAGDGSLPELVRIEKSNLIREFMQSLKDDDKAKISARVHENVTGAVHLPYKWVEHIIPFPIDVQGKEDMLKLTKHLKFDPANYNVHAERFELVDKDGVLLMVKMHTEHWMPVINKWIPITNTVKVSDDDLITRGDMYPGVSKANLVEEVTEHKKWWSPIVKAIKDRVS